jgi:hypothetical protein
MCKKINRQRKIELQRAILELEKSYPEDDLVLSYSDFLKTRDFLVYYQFNPAVFENLIRLTLDLWNTGRRINRLSLLLKSKQYLHASQQSKEKDSYSSYIRPGIKHPSKTKKLLFNLFRKTFEKSSCLSNKQVEEARKICNSLLINLALTSKEEEWLCSNIHVSELILNRVLRYPVKSEIISNWAKNNFHNTLLINRRAELISWIIDQEPSYEIDRQTLIDDFELLNQIDVQTVQNYDDEIAANKILVRELSEYLPRKIHYDPITGENFKEEIDLSVPELKLSRRHYSVTIDMNREFPTIIPDFEKLRENFYANLPAYQKMTMIWGIAYSRLGNEVKYSLLKKYYSDETYYSMYKVCKKTKNIELLKWVLEQQ